MSYLFVPFSVSLSHSVHQTNFTHNRSLSQRPAVHHRRIHRAPTPNPVLTPSAALSPVAPTPNPVLTPSAALSPVAPDTNLDGDALLASLKPALPLPSLLAAARDKDAPALTSLIASGASPSSANPSGWTALKWSARAGSADAAAFLVAAGARACAANKFGCTALHHAAH